MRQLNEIINSKAAVQLKLTQLSLDPKNSRVHDCHNIEMIKKSLNKFGQYRSFVVQKEGMIIRVGNGMYQAMLSLAEDENTNIDDVIVNCVVLDLTDEEAEVLSIVDNKASDTSYFDNAQLGNIFKDMSQDNIQLTGFSNQEVSKVLEAFNVDINDLVDPTEEVKPENENDQGAKKVLMQYKLLFENEQQKTTWDKFVNEVKGLYGESVCESIHLFIIEYFRDSGKEIQNQ